MSIKQKLLDMIAAHPKLAAFSIALATMMAIAAATGIFDYHQSHLAFASSKGGIGQPS